MILFTSPIIPSAFVIISVTLLLFWYLELKKNNVSNDVSWYKLIDIIVDELLNKNNYTIKNNSNFIYMSLFPIFKYSSVCGKTPGSIG